MPRPQPHIDPKAAASRRAANLRAFRRNQTLGLILIAAVILAWWYFHANKSWIWTPGWWRP